MQLVLKLLLLQVMRVTLFFKIIIFHGIPHDPHLYSMAFPELTEGGGGKGWGWEG